MLAIRSWQACQEGVRLNLRKIKSDPIFTIFILHLGYLRIGHKNIFDARLKQLGDLESQRQRWVVLAGFYGVYGLPRNIEVLSKRGLGPVSLRSKDTKFVIHE